MAVEIQTETGRSNKNQKHKDVLTVYIRYCCTYNTTDGRYSKQNTLSLIEQFALTAKSRFVTNPLHIPRIQTVDQTISTV